MKDDMALHRGLPRITRAKAWFRVSQPGNLSDRGGDASETGLVIQHGSRIIPLGSSSTYHISTFLVGTFWLGLTPQLPK